jgi:HEAT repeat protein
MLHPTGAAFRLYNVSGSSRPRQVSLVVHALEYKFDSLAETHCWQEERPMLQDATFFLGVTLLCMTCAGPAPARQKLPRKTQDVAALIEKLKDKDSYTRREALASLGRIGPAAKAAIPAVTNRLKDKNPFVRIYAASALKRIDPQNKIALPVLLNALRVKDETVRCYAANAFNPFGVAAVPGLIKAFKDPDPAVGMWASGAVVLIGQEAIPLLRKARKEKNPQVRRHAKQALEMIEPLDK